MIGHYRELLHWNHGEHSRESSWNSDQKLACPRLDDEKSGCTNRRRHELMTSLLINKCKHSLFPGIWRHWVNIASYGGDVSADRRKYRVDERSSRWSEYLAAQISLSNDFFLFMSRVTIDSYRAAVRTWTEGILRIRQVRRYRRSGVEVVDRYWNRNYTRRKRSKDGC